MFRHPLILSVFLLPWCLCALGPSTLLGDGEFHVVPPPDDPYHNCLARIEKLKEAGDIAGLEKEADFIEKTFGEQEDLWEYTRLMAKWYLAMTNQHRFGDNYADLQKRVDSYVWRAVEKAERLPLIDPTVTLLLGPRFYEGPREQPLPPKEFAQRRARAMKCVFIFWSRLERTIDPEFDEKDNNSRPAGPPPLPPLVERRGEGALAWAKYEAELRWRQAAEARYAQQSGLHRLRAREWPDLEKWVVEAYRTEPQAIHELEALLKQYVADQAVCERILQAVRKDGATTAASQPREK